MSEENKLARPGSAGVRKGARPRRKRANYPAENAAGAAVFPGRSTGGGAPLADEADLRGKAVTRSVDYSELKLDVAITVSAWSRASAGAIESTWSAGYRSKIRLACATEPQWGQAGS